MSTQSGSQEDERIDSLRITEKKAKIGRLNYETLDIYKKTDVSRVLLPGISSSSGDTERSPSLQCFI